VVPVTWEHATKDPARVIRWLRNAVPSAA
jgi:hypothetical protein